MVPPIALAPGLDPSIRHATRGQVRPLPLNRRIDGPARFIVGTAGLEATTPTVNLPRNQASTNRGDTKKAGP
jgi:hypothetical protein